MSLGNLSEARALLALFCLFVIIVWLMIRGIKGAIIIGVLVITLLSFAWGITPVPQSIMSFPPSLSPIAMQLNIVEALSIKNLPVVLIIFIMAFVDTVGTLIGLSARAGLLDRNGNLPEIEKPMLADAVANLMAPVLGTTTTGAYIESAAGIAEGGGPALPPLLRRHSFCLPCSSPLF